MFQEHQLPDDKKVILGVIDTKSNHVEHPRLVADRLVQLGKIIGKERVIGGTDCGFDTFIRFSLVDPGVAWLTAESAFQTEPRLRRASSRTLRLASSDL